MALLHEEKPRNESLAPNSSSISIPKPMESKSDSASHPKASTVRRGLVLGCGGTLGTAWMIAALSAVERALDWDVRTAEVLVGTSAGAELVALLGAGVSVDALVSAQIGGPDADPFLARHFASPPRAFPPWPTPRMTSSRLARKLFDHRVPSLTSLTALLPEGRGDAAFLASLVDGWLASKDRSNASGTWVAHPATWVVGVDADSGERVAFGAPGAPSAHLRDAVRASWAIPGWFPPVEIGGRRYVDGGVFSPTSADLVAPLGLDEVVVVAPMASSNPGPRKGLFARAEGLLRGSMQRTVDAEVAKLRAVGTRVLRIDPEAEELAIMGPHFMDADRRLRVLESSLRTCRRTVRHALERDAFVGAPLG